MRFSHNNQTQLILYNGSNWCFHAASAHTVNCSIKSSRNNPLPPPTVLVEGWIIVLGLWIASRVSAVPYFVHHYSLLIELQKVQLIRRLTPRTREISGNKKTPWWWTLQPLTFSWVICLCLKNSAVVTAVRTRTSALCFVECSSEAVFGVGCRLKYEIGQYFRIVLIFPYTA